MCNKMHGISIRAKLIKNIVLLRQNAVEVPMELALFMTQLARK